MAVATAQRAGRRIALPRLRAEREKRGWTVLELANRAGVSWPTAARADDGEAINLSTASKIVVALRLAPITDDVMDRLLGEEST